MAISDLVVDRGRRTAIVKITRLLQFMLLGLWVAMPPAYAQADSELAADEPRDQVFVQPVRREFDAWNPVTPTRWEGSIVEFDAEQLTLIDKQGERRRIPSAQVQRIVLTWASDQVREAVALFEQREYRESVQPLQASLASGVPRWQQRILISYLVRAASALGQPKSAGVLFLNLADNSPPPMLLADMPLCWTTEEPDRTLREAAREWLVDSRPEAQLLGASWLLATADRDQAQRVLRQLRESAPAPLSELAEAQSWRLTPPPQTLERLDTWLEFRNLMLQPLQLGPTEWLAERLQRVGQSDLAIGEWMRIATLHADRYDRASRALQHAEDVLRQMEEAQQAERVKQWRLQLEENR